MAGDGTGHDGSDHEGSGDGGKADFTDLYDAPDPRGLYRRLRELDYQVPAHAVPVFRRLLERLRAERSDPAVLDVCSSFGVNATLMNHDVEFADVLQRYASPALARLSTARLAAEDRLHFAGLRRPDAVRVVGLDVAANAVSYATRAGLMDDGVVADLESGAPPPTDLRERLRGVALVTVTGGIGYVQERTFRTVLDAVGAERPPWVAAFALRWIGIERIERALAEYGLVTEQVPGRLVRQRRFADEGEQRHVLRALAARGLEPTPAEVHGWHVAEVFLSRPAGTAAREPLSEVLPASTS